MNRAWRMLRSWVRRRNRRERAILVCLLVLVAAQGCGRLLMTLHFEPRRQLLAAVQHAEQQALHHHQLLSREDEIHLLYRRITAATSAAVADSCLTETGVLRELSGLAGGQVIVKSVVPRLETRQGRPVMVVALDCEGPFTAVVRYVEQIIQEMQSEVTSLSIAPRPDAGGDVLCRMLIRVVGLGPHPAT